MKKATFALLLAFALMLPAAQVAGAQDFGRRGGPPGGPMGAPTTAAAGRIQGHVVDAQTKETIETATVAVWRTADSTLATGAIAEDGGRFDIQGLRPGRYYVTVTFIGYVPKRINNITINTERLNIDLAEVTLTPATSVLDEVQVTADRTQMEVHIDRTVYTVKDQLVATGGSATDVLKNIPAVEVDVDGKVSLRGSQNVAIMINGRPSQMSPDMLAAFLEGLPANSIDRVEVIPNPSARYDPDGMSGILNIVLKRDTNIGVNGNLTAGLGTQDNYSASGMLALGRGPVGLRVNYGLRTGKRISEGDRFNEYRQAGPADFLQTFNTGENTSFSHNLNFNLDYRLNNKSSFSGFGTLSSRNSNGDELTTYEEMNDLRALVRNYERFSGRDGGEVSGEVGLNFKSVIKPAAHELSAEFRYETEVEQDEHEYRQEFLRAATGVLPPSLLENTDQDEDSGDMVLQADYMRPLGADTRMEAGYKGLVDRLNSSLYNQDFNPATGLWTPDATENNEFVYDQQVHAVYGILGHQLGKVGMQVGLRAETAITTFDLKTTREAYDNNYTSLFPNAYVSYQFTPLTSLRLSYSKRIQRPHTRMLNPFSPNEDPLFRRVGNPYLKPEYIHAFEANLSTNKEKYSLTVSPYYRHSVDLMRHYTSMDAAGVTTLSFANLATSDSYGAEFIGSLRPSSRINMFASFNLYQISTDGTNVEASMTNQALGWGARANANIVITPTLDAQIMYFYRAPMKIEQGHMGAFAMSNIALRQRLMGNKASLTLRVNDLFDQMAFTMWRDTPQYYLSTNRYGNARTLQLALQYNFGKQDNSRRSRFQEGTRDRGGEFEEMQYQ